MREVTKQIMTAYALDGIPFTLIQILVTKKEVAEDKCLPCHSADSADPQAPFASTTA